MHIAMLTSDYLPNIGGIASHVYYLSKTLSAKGVRISIVNPVPGAHFAIEAAQDPDHLLLYRVRYKRHRTRAGRLWERSLAIAHALRCVEREYPLDIIHQHDYLSSVLGVRLYRGSAKWVWTNHSSMFLDDWNKKMKRVLVSALYHGLSGIIGVSEELHRKSREMFNDTLRCIYIPNGVDTTVFYPMTNTDAIRIKYGIDPDEFVVLCPRRCVEKNGVIHLAHAINIILERHESLRKWKFVLLGTDVATNTDETYILKIRELLRAAHEQGVVMYLGNVPPSHMPLVNAMADVVVIPSLVEAVSLSALEALATRKPVIATNVGGLPSVIRHGQTGYLVEPGNAQSIAEALVELASCDGLREALAEGGYHLVRDKFTWGHVADATLEFYNRIIRRQ